MREGLAMDSAKVPKTSGGVLKVGTVISATEAAQSESGGAW